MNTAGRIPANFLSLIFSITQICVTRCESAFVSLTCWSKELRQADCQEQNAGEYTKLGQN